MSISRRKRRSLSGASFNAEVAELADAHGSGPCTRKGVGVRVPPSAPKFVDSSLRSSRRAPLVAGPSLQCIQTLAWNERHADPAREDSRPHAAGGAVPQSRSRL